MVLEQGAVHVKISRVAPFVVAAAVFSFQACSDTTSIIPALVADSTITKDVAVSAGDAIATAVSDMLANESASSLSAVIGDIAPEIVYNRTRTCYDANGGVVTNCVPLASVRKIITHVVLNGSRSGTSGDPQIRTVSWSGAVHRTADDTLQRNFTGSTESSRTHSALSTGHDTTTFSDGTISRFAAETASDAVKALTWNLPHSQNPWPVSGKIVREVAVHVVATRENETVTRDVSRVVEVTFPADAQGNVVLTINGKTCNLNLVTHITSACH